MDEKVAETDEPKSGGRSYDEKAAQASIIAKPMAPKKLAKKLFKLTKEAKKHKCHLRQGLKMVQSRLRRGEKGIVLLAGNASPVDTIIHLPGLCEAKDVPYVFVPSGSDIGMAMNVNRSCVCVLILPKTEYQELYESCFEKVKLLPIPYSS